MEHVPSFRPHRLRQARRGLRVEDAEADDVALGQLADPGGRDVHVAVAQAGDDLVHCPPAPEELFPHMDGDVVAIHAPRSHQRVQLRAAEDRAARAPVAPQRRFAGHERAEVQRDGEAVADAMDLQWRAAVRAVVELRGEPEGRRFGEQRRRQRRRRQAFPDLVQHPYRASIPGTAPSSADVRSAGDAATRCRTVSRRFPCREKSASPQRQSPFASN